MAIQLWEFPVQWSGSFTVTSSFKTEIISSYTGKEQRRSMRAYPRRSFSFKLDALPGTIDGLQSFLSTSQRNLVVMPEPVRRRRTTSALASGQAIVDVTGIAPWMKEQGYVALIAESRVQVFQISDIFDSSLAFTEAATAPWPKDVRIVPAWKGLLAESLSFSLPTNRIMQGGIEFSVIPGEELSPPPETPIEDTVLGRELFTFRTNWNDAPTADYTQERDIVDYGRGVIALFTPVPYAAKSYTTNILNFNPDQAYLLTEFFERMKGRRGEFLFSPPGRQRMPLAEDYTPEATWLRIAGDEARLAYVGDPTLRVLAVAMKPRDGLDPVVHYRLVTSATAVEGNTVFGFANAIPEIISVDTVKDVSWLSLARFESDDLTIDWKTTQVSTAQIVVRALEYLTPEDSFGFDEGTQWLIDTYGAGFVIKYILDPTSRVLNEIEPRFALIVDEATQYLIDTYDRDPANRWFLDGMERIVNQQLPRFAEV